MRLAAAGGEAGIEARAGIRERMGLTVAFTERGGRGNSGGSVQGFGLHRLAATGGAGDEEQAEGSQPGAGSAVHGPCIA